MVGASPSTMILTSKESEGRAVVLPHPPHRVMPRDSSYWVQDKSFTNYRVCWAGLFFFFFFPENTLSGLSDGVNEWTPKSLNKEYYSPLATTHSLITHSLISYPCYPESKNRQWQDFPNLMWTVNSLEKTLMLGNIEGKKKRGWQRMNEMVGWHHGLNGHESEKTPWDSEG